MNKRKIGENILLLNKNLFKNNLKWGLFRKDGFLYAN